MKEQVKQKEKRILLRSRGKSVKNKLEKETLCVKDKWKKESLVKEIGEGVPAKSHGMNPLSITQSTHRKHTLLLAAVKDMSPSEIVSYLRRERRSRRWRWSTLRTKIGNLLGANTMAGYTAFQNACPIMRDFRKYVDIRTMQEMPTFPRALTMGDAERILLFFKTSKMWLPLALFSLWWATASRLSDMLALHVERVSVQDTTVLITFVEGKGVRARGSPYSVSVVNPFASHVARLVHERQGHKYLIPFKIHDKMRALFRATLKTLHPKYELRSPRRGSLQTMASAGVTLSVLRSISGHQSDRMLLRYLDWGRFAQVQASEQVQATNLIWS